MTVRILIKRQVPPTKIGELSVLLKRLRSITLMQPGYISGQTLRRLDTDDECLVVSTWRSAQDWYAWENNPKRLDLQNQIDALLDTPTTYAVYE